MTQSKDDLRRLLFINALFEHVTGSDLYLANQIKSAIAFSLAELEEQTRAHPEFADKFDAAFNASAASLLEKIYSGQRSHGFFHWDASKTLHSATMLFARAELMVGLKQLAPFPASTVLVTNLRPALLPPKRRVTAKRLKEYTDLLDFIRDLAAARKTSTSHLQLLFL